MSMPITLDDATRQAIANAAERSYGSCASRFRPTTEEKREYATAIASLGQWGDPADHAWATIDSYQRLRDAGWSHRQIMAATTLDDDLADSWRREALKWTAIGPDVGTTLAVEATILLHPYIGGAAASLIRALCRDASSDDRLVLAILGTADEIRAAAFIHGLPEGHHGTVKGLRKVIERLAYTGSARGVIALVRPITMLPRIRTVQVVDDDGERIGEGERVIVRRVTTIDETREAARTFLAADD